MSAKTGENVDEAFINIINILVGKNIPYVVKNKEKYIEFKKLKLNDNYDD